MVVNFFECARTVHPLSPWIGLMQNLLEPMQPRQKAVAGDGTQRAYFFMELRPPLEAPDNKTGGDSPASAVVVTTAGVEVVSVGEEPDGDIDESNSSKASNEKAEEDMVPQLRVEGRIR